MRGFRMGVPGGEGRSHRAPRRWLKGGSGSGGGGKSKGGGGGAAAEPQSDQEIVQSMVDAGMSQSDAKGWLNTYKSLDERDPADKAFKEALLVKHDKVMGTESSLDRVYYLRRLDNRSSKLNQNDIRDLAGSFRQALRGGNGSPVNLAAMEYTSRIYNRLTSAGKTTFARELGTTSSLAPDSRLQTNPKFRGMVNDVQRRQSRVGTEPVQAIQPRVSRGRQNRMFTNFTSTDDNPFGF